MSDNVAEMIQEAALHSDSKPGFPIWLAPGLLFYSVMAIFIVGDSLSIKIVENRSGRVIADSWMTTLTGQLVTGGLDPRDTASIAGSIATNTLQLLFGCFLGLTVFALLARKRGASTACYFINLFQLVVGLAFFYYYPRDRDVRYVWDGGALISFAILQYWVLSKPRVRRWLRSYSVEFFSLTSSDPTIQTFLRHVSIRKGIAGLVMGFQVFMIALTAYAGVDAVVGLLLNSNNSLEGILDVFAILYLLALPLFALYPTLAIVALFWRHPPRILLLRPFHSPRVSKSLKDIVRDSIGYFAHVYTLSDREIYQRVYIKWPIALPQMWLLHFRARHLTKADSVDKLEKRVRRTIARNINWFASSGKLFSVSASEDMWKPCVSRLISLADAVLFDISNPSEGIGWELDQIMRHDRSQDITFVVWKPEIENALKFLRLKGVTAEIGVNVFGYDDEGMAFLERFTTRFALSLTAARTRTPVPLASH